MGKLKLEIQEEKIKDCEDSFWYDGLIATIGNYRLIATGEIRIIDTKQNIIAHDGQFRDSDFEKLVVNDKTLAKYVGQNYDDNYYWANNNWFEVVYGREIKNGQVVIEDCDMCVVEYDYDSAIKLLENYAKEKTYEKRSKK